MSTNTTHRILAVNLRSRCFGFAVLETPATLVDWGCPETRGDKHFQALKKIKHLIARYAPDLVGIEDCSRKPVKHRARFDALVAAIVEICAESGTKVRIVNRAEIRKYFLPLGIKTKHQIATVLAKQMPELSDQLPENRTSWMDADRRMNIFDAVASAMSIARSGRSRLKK